MTKKRKDGKIFEEGANFALVPEFCSAFLHYATKRSYKLSLPIVCNSAICF